MGWVVCLFIYLFFLSMINDFFFLEKNDNDWVCLYVIGWVYANVGFVYMLGFYKK